MAGNQLLIQQSTTLQPNPDGGKQLRMSTVLDDFGALLLHTRVGARIDDPILFNFPDWNLIATDGTTVLWTMTDISVLYARVPVGELFRVIVRLAFAVIPRGFMRVSGADLHVLTKGSDGRVLDDWDTGPLQTACDEMAPQTYVGNLAPELFSRVASCALHIDAGGIWQRCGPS